MFLVTVLPGIDQYIGKGIKQFGETISLFTETDRKTQRAIRNMLTENPDLIQDFADLESRAPGSLKEMGFGKIADLVMKSPESVEQEVGRTTRDDQVRTGVATATGDRQRAEFGVEAFDNILGTLGLPEDITNVMRGSFGLPTTEETESIRKKSELEEVQHPVNMATAMTAGIYSEQLLQAAERGEDIKGPIADFVAAFMEGTDDPNITASILQNPLTGPQFEAQMELAMWEKNADLQRELVGLRASSSAANMPASIRAGLAMMQDLQKTSAEVSRLLEEYPDGVGLKYIWPEIVNTRLDPQGVRLRAAVASLSSTLFHLRSGTAVTASEKTRLEPLTPNRWDPHEAIEQKLIELNRFFEEYINIRSQSLSDLESSGADMSLTQGDIDRMVDKMISEDKTDVQINAMLRAQGIIR